MRHVISKALAACLLISLVLTLGALAAQAAPLDPAIHAQLSQVQEKAVKPSGAANGSRDTGGGAAPKSPWKDPSLWLTPLVVLGFLPRPRAKEIDGDKVRAYIRAFLKEAVKAALILIGMGLVIAILQPGLAILVPAVAILTTFGFGVSYIGRREEQIAADIDPGGWKTAGVAFLDTLGLSGLAEGIRAKRLLTDEPLNPAEAGGALGSGLVYGAVLGAGLHALANRFSAIGPLLRRTGRTVDAWPRMPDVPEATLANLWRILGAIGEGAPYTEVVAKLPAPLRTLVHHLIEVGYLTLQDDGILRGPAGKVSLVKANEALIAGASRALNRFNNIKGGYGQLEARQYIEADEDFKRFLTEPRDPSAPGIDEIVEMQDDSFHIAEVKHYDSPVGANQVHRALKYTPGKQGQPPEVKIDTKRLEADIKARLNGNKAEMERVLEALQREDGSVVLRIELVECEATGPLAELNGKVINGVKILVKQRPKGGM